MLLRAWTVLCTVFVAAGWLLSALGQLNPPAYIVVLCLALFVVIAQVRTTPIRWRFPLRRFRRPLPLAYSILALLVFLGGALHPPNNYEGVSFRLPRLLQWFAAGHWFWIPTVNERMNYGAANFEWFTAPLFLLTRSDRLLFLVNFVPFLLLPGLLFSVYRLLRVPGRVAWSWMWILPAGYCYALQAGSIANDALGAVLILASLCFGLRASQRNSAMDAGLALLALALATGMERTNLPLVLPCVVALWPARRLLAGRRLASIGLLAVALLVSYLPTGILNHHYANNWNGYGPRTMALQIHSPIAGMIVSTLRLGVQTMQPPLCPSARSIDTALTSGLPHGIKDLIKDDYSQLELALGELPQEEVSGLGLGVVALLFVSLFARFFFRSGGVVVPAPKSAPNAGVVILTAWIAFFLYQNPIGCEPTARQLAPYFPLLLPALIKHPINSFLARKWWWNLVARLGLASAAMVIVLIPARPLWPAATVLGELQSRRPQSQMLVRARQVFSVYEERNDLLGPLRELLPADAVRVGAIASEADADYSLWRPFGHRTVVYLVGAQSWEEETGGFTWIVGKTSLLDARYGKSLEQARLASGGLVIGTRLVISTVRNGPEEWFVLKLPETAGPRAQQVLAITFSANGESPRRKKWLPVEWFSRFLPSANCKLLTPASLSIENAAAKDPERAPLGARNQLLLVSGRIPVDVLASCL